MDTAVPNMFEISKEVGYKFRAHVDHTVTFIRVQSSSHTGFTFDVHFLEQDYVFWRSRNGL